MSGKQVGRPSKYRKPLMSLFVEKKELSINDLIDELPPMDRKCKACDGHGIGVSGTCKKCVKGKSKVDYNAVFREIKNLVKDNLIETVMEIKHDHGKHTEKYDITTNGAIWYVNNNSTMNTDWFVDMLVSRASENNTYQFIEKASKKEKKNHFETHRLERKIGFSLTDVVKYFEIKVLHVSREFVFPEYAQQTINKLEYFTEDDLDLIRKSFLILNNLCTNKIMTIESIYERVKKDFTLLQFKKLIKTMASMDLFFRFSKNNTNFIALTFTGLLLFYHSLEEPINKSTLNSIQKYGALLLPRLFSNQIFAKLLTKIKKEELFIIFLDLYFYDKSLTLIPLDKNKNKCFRLIIAQESLVLTYRGIITAFYSIMLFRLNLEIAVQFPNFKLMETGEIHPRISEIFRDLYYSGYRTGRDGEKEPSGREILQYVQKKYVEYKVSIEDFDFIVEKYRELIYELLELDKLIYGDDIIHETSHVQSIEELTGSVENIRTVFEFRSWIFLKGSYPKICDDVMNEDKTLLSWYNKWEDEIKKFEKQYVVSLE